LYTDTFEVTSTTGLAEREALPLTLYPNPASTAVWVDFGEPVSAATQLSLLNVNGRVLRRQAWNPAGSAATLRFELSPNLAEGVYLLRVEQAGRQNTARVVVR